MAETIIASEEKEPLMALTGSDTGPSYSLVPIGLPEEVKKGENEKQDKEQAHSAPTPLSKGSNSGETHVTVLRAKALTKRQKDDLRVVAWALSGEVLGRLEDERFLWFIREQISLDEQLDTLISDSKRRNREVPDFFHVVVSILQLTLNEWYKEYSIVPTKEENDLALRWAILFFVIGASWLIIESHAGAESEQPKEEIAYA